MKKRLLSLLFLCLMCLFAAGCSANETPQIGIQEGLAANDSLDNSKVELHKKPEDTDTVDVDLTVLSSTMVYAEVYNIMTSPDDYIGKTIKICGPYYASFYDETGLYYHFVIIEDAAACCQSGLEFVWEGEHSYPDDYPEEQTEIGLTGVFKSYEELGETYYYLAVDEITILQQ